MAAIAALLAAFGMIAYLNVGTASADESTCTPLTGFEQPLCDADAAPPSEEELRAALQTNRDGAVFWTGRVNEQSVEQRAADFATGTNGTTLELALLRAEIVMPVFADRTPEAVATWELASRLFAEQASGTAFVVMGPELRDGNVFETQEFPALKDNPEIERVIRVDAVTEERTEIFNRDDNDPGEDIPADGDGPEKRDPGEGGQRITIEADGNVNEGKCVDAAGAETGQGLTLQTCNGTARQIFSQAGDLLVTTFSEEGNLCLSREGNRIIAKDCSVADRWTFEFPQWKINGTDQCLDIEGERSDDGAPLIAFRCKEDDATGSIGNQEWFNADA